MGIRFWCPNGHKLHVKTFQAGRVGICPHCGAKFLIPEKSTRPGSKEAAEQTLETAPAGTTEGVLPLGGGASPPVATPSAIPVAARATVPVATPMTKPGASDERTALPMGQPLARVAPVASISGNPTPLSVSPATAFSSPPAGTLYMPSPSLGASGPATSSAYPLGSVPAAPATPPAPAGPPDPIAEAPNAVWYVRPPSGGQFGPAAGDVMRSWIGEGRVSADTLVWREGWRDWQEASAVFPNLGGSQELLPGVVAVSPTARGAGVAHGGSGDRLKARRRAKNLQVGVMVVLALAVVVLIGVFVWVLGQAPPTPKPVSDGPVPPATSGPPAPDTPPMKQAEPPKP